jgi:hypothetical protein
MATLQKVGAVLTSPKDWVEWLETIKTAREAVLMWPNTSDERVLWKLACYQE